MWRTINLRVGGGGGVRRPQETRDWDQSVCTVGHGRNSAGSPVLSLTWLARINAGSRSFGCVCVRVCCLFRWNWQGRLVLSAGNFGEENLYNTGDVSLSLGVTQWVWYGLGEMLFLDTEAEIITFCHANRNRLGYFSPRKNRVICNVKCWVRAGQRRHAECLSVKMYLLFCLFNVINIIFFTSILMIMGLNLGPLDLTRIAVAGGFYQYSKEMELNISHAYDL